jgi:Na+/melibiose symporter-like transporter
VDFQGLAAPEWFFSSLSFHSVNKISVFFKFIIYNILLHIVHTHTANQKSFYFSFWFQNPSASQVWLHCIVYLAISCLCFVTVRALGQHRPDTTLIRKHVKLVMERLFHISQSIRSMPPSECCLEKSKSMSI